MWKLEESQEAPKQYKYNENNQNDNRKYMIIKKIKII